MYLFVLSDSITNEVKGHDKISDRTDKQHIEYRSGTQKNISKNSQQTQWKTTTQRINNPKLTFLVVIIQPLAWFGEQINQHIEWK